MTTIASVCEGDGTNSLRLLLRALDSERHCTVRSVSFLTREGVTQFMANPTSFKRCQITMLPYCNHKSHYPTQLPLDHHLKPSNTEKQSTSHTPFIHSILFVQYFYFLNGVPVIAKKDGNFGTRSQNQPIKCRMARCVSIFLVITVVLEKCNCHSQNP